MRADDVVDPGRSAVPGAIRGSASSSGSRRGSPPPARVDRPALIGSRLPLQRSPPDASSFSCVSGGVRHAARPVRHEAAEPELGALLQAALGLRAGRSRPVSPISPKRRVRLATACPAPRGDRERDRQVGGRLVDAHAAGDVDEDVGLAERDPRVPPSTATIIARRFGSTPSRRAAAWRGRRRTSAWISRRKRARPLERARDGRARSPPATSAEERRRIGHADEPVAGHLEDAELVRRAEAVLHGAQDPVRAIAVALELEHAVDQVLEHARARDGALLRDVADEDRGDALLLRDAQERDAASRT